MDILAISMSTAMLVTGISSVTEEKLATVSPHSEYCAMTSLGNELTKEASNVMPHRYSLSEAYQAKPIVNYKLVERNQMSELCELYLATN